MAFISPNLTSSARSGRSLRDRSTSEGDGHRGSPEVRGARQPSRELPMKTTVEEFFGPSCRCPDRDALVDFALGKLPAPEADAVADHLCSCEPCQEVLCEIQEENIDDSE